MAKQVISLFLCGLALGQAPQSLTFEVASIRPSGPKSLGGEHGDAAQISIDKITMDRLLRWAYNVETFQIEGPSWVRSETDAFDLHAKITPDTTPEQKRIMVRNLLIGRFHLRLHHVSKEFPSYELQVAKGGPKFKESVIDPSQPVAPWNTPNGPAPKGADGFARVPAGAEVLMVTHVGGGGARMIAQQQPMSSIIFWWRMAAGRPIVDRTGLTGKFDLKVFYDDSAGLFRQAAEAEPGDGNDPAPSLQRALEQQLGLKLLDKKTAFDVLVIDHVDKVPVEN